MRLSGGVPLKQRIMSDIELVEGLRRGNREAAREMIRSYYPSVLRFLTILCRTPEDAEELTQEAFIKALKCVRRFRGECGLRTWLHRIAFCEYTHRRRKQRPSLRLTDHYPASPFETTSLLAIDLERALMRLSEEIRAAFVLCEIQELSVNEAAIVLSVPAGTVKSRLHTARQRLQALLTTEQEVKINV